MCGIAGLVSRVALVDIERDIVGMTRSLQHRGPDYQGVWVHPGRNAALGHSRLSVIDPDKRSNQPMVSASGRYILTFNGELYNHVALREALIQIGTKFVTRSDTEVLVEAANAWGIQKTLQAIEGMFAFALYDVEGQHLWLCRDRFGLKPCYWMWQDGVLAFGSEIKAILEWWKKPLPIDPSAVKSLLDFGYIQSPSSIFRPIQQLEPGTILTLEFGKEPKTEYFWNLMDAKREGIVAGRQRGKASLPDELDELINSVVDRYVQTEVPVGCFLSGGFDSSILAAIAARKTSGPLKTFAIGFEEPLWDESWKARAVSSHIGTDHHEIILGQHDVLDLVKDLPVYYDEPFADFSQLPTLAVSRLARDHVTVCLSGDGGDELFGGYDRYSWAQNFWATFKALPDNLRTPLLAALEKNQLHLDLSGPMPSQVKFMLSEVAKKVPFGHPVKTFGDLYRRIMQTGPVSQFDGSATVSYSEFQNWDDCQDLTLTDRMQLYDIRRYMGDGILTKVDRASMSVGLEVRVPFLNEKIAQYAFALPESAKFTADAQRELQKAVAYRYVPRELLDYPKMGFGFPIDSWLRTHLRDWAEDLLSVRSLAEVPFLKRNSIRTLWEAHCQRVSNEHWRLWPILIYVQWHRHWRKYIADPAPSA